MSVNEVTKPPEGFPSIFKGGEGLNEGRGGLLEKVVYLIKIYTKKSLCSDPHLFINISF